MERALTFLKPDAVVRRSAGCEVIKKLLSLPDAKLVEFRETQVPEELARLHYAEHVHKPFFHNIVDMISASTGVVLLIFEGKDIVRRIRDTLGPTFVEKAIAADPNCCRGKHGIVAGINACHASDSPASGERECALWMGVLGLKFEPEVALKAAKAYLLKYDGVHQELASDAQKFGRELQSAFTSLREVLKKETDLNEEAVNAVMRSVALSLK